VKEPQQSGSSEEWAMGFPIYTWRTANVTILTGLRILDIFEGLK
jgi:hypothetical protein